MCAFVTYEIITVISTKHIMMGVFVFKVY